MASATRLECKALPGVILIDQATYEAVSEVVAAEKLEPMAVKGEAEPVTV